MIPEVENTESEQGSNMINPRRDPKSVLARSHWYPYYAGYSALFAEQLLLDPSIPRNARVADPWNGGGTTTAVASKLGLQSWGGDLNPAMVIVAKARSTPSFLSKRLRDIAAQLVKVATQDSRQWTGNDPLSEWVDEYKDVRAIELALRDWCEDQGQLPEIPAEMSPIACVLYLALFRVSRALAAHGFSSNPTWIKKRSTVAPRVESYRSRDVIAEFLGQVNSMAADMERDGFAGKCVLDHASSENIPLADKAVDLVLTSPPYCTRIDYAVATSIELAVLDYGASARDRLRRSLIGRTTIDEAPVNKPMARWGSKCIEFLDAVKAHPTKASSSYYYKSHVQYFDGLFRSIEEVARIVKSSGRVIFVVQDSYYKNVRNDLAVIVEEMFYEAGMRLLKRDDFRKHVNMRSLNTTSRAYGVHTPPVESVLQFIY